MNSDLLLYLLLFLSFPVGMNSCLEQSFIGWAVKIVACGLFFFSPPIFSGCQVSSRDKLQSEFQINFLTSRDHVSFFWMGRLGFVESDSQSGIDRSFKRILFCLYYSLVT